jgi:hypothetical protein
MECIKKSDVTDSMSRRWSHDTNVEFEHTAGHKNLHNFESFIHQKFEKFVIKRPNDIVSYLKTPLIGYKFKITSHRLFQGFRLERMRININNETIPITQQ